MKQIVNLSLTIFMFILLFAIPSIVQAESNTEWKIWSPKTEVDIDKEWVIKFSDEIDWKSLSGNIFVVRERDNKRIYVHPEVYSDDKHLVKLYLDSLYDFDETYYLYIKDIKAIDGSILKEPIKMKFQTVNPEFNMEKTVEKDGVEFHTILGKTKERVYAKIKATNVSEEAIPYLGYDGCDRGISANIFFKNDNGQVESGSKWWNSLISCSLVVMQYFLEPGETIELFEVLNQSTVSLDNNAYLKITLQKGDTSAYLPQIEVAIPIDSGFETIPRYIVAFKDGVSQSEKDKIINEVEGTIISKGEYFYVVYFYPVSLTDRVLNSLQENDNIKYVEEDYIVHPASY